MAYGGIFVLGGSRMSTTPRLTSTMSVSNCQSCGPSVVFDCPAVIEHATALRDRNRDISEDAGLRPRVTVNLTHIVRRLKFKVDNLQRSPVPSNDHSGDGNIINDPIREMQESTLGVRTWFCLTN